MFTRDLYNESMLSNQSYMVIGTAVITEELDITGAVVTGMPVDDINISYEANKIGLKEDITLTSINGQNFDTDIVGRIDNNEDRLDEFDTYITEPKITLDSNSNTSLFVNSDNSNSNASKSEIWLQTNIRNDAGYLSLQTDGSKKGLHMNTTKTGYVSTDMNLYFGTGGVISSQGNPPTQSVQPTTSLTILDSDKSVNVSAGLVLRVDEITEQTTNNGCIIESVLLKDGLVNGVDVTAIEDRLDEFDTYITKPLIETDQLNADYINSSTLMTADNIVEYSFDSGVTIENVLLKDDSVTATTINGDEIYADTVTSGEIISDNILMGSTRTNSVVGTGVDLHIQKTEDCVLFLESDYNNVLENSNPTIAMSQDGLVIYSEMGIRQTNNSTHISTYSTSASLNNNIAFCTGGEMNRTVGNLATITTPASTRLSINETGLVTIDKDLIINEDLTVWGNIVVDNGELIMNSSTFTPSLTNVSNIASVGNVQFRYQKIGDIVYFTYVFTCSVSVAGTLGIFDLTTLPYTSAFTNSYGAVGRGDGDTFPFVQFCRLTSKSSSTNIRVDVYCNDTSVHAYSCNGQYRII